MLERYYSLASHLAQMRSAWVGAGLERFALWLAERQSAHSTVHTRVGRAWSFCQFALSRGAKKWQDLPSLVEPFISFIIETRGPNRRPGPVRKKLLIETRRSITHFLAVNLPRPRKLAPLPLARTAHGFWDYLSQERGLNPRTVRNYKVHLREFEGFLRLHGCRRLSLLSTRIAAGFIAECAKRMGIGSIRIVVSILRVLVKYLYRERLLKTDFSAGIDRPIYYRLSSIPKSISWQEVGRLLRSVDPDLPAGRRNRAILLLLVSYGLRASEVANLTLSDLDWRNSKLHVQRRKSGNSTVYPLSNLVGEAILDYLRHRRPKSTDRHVFLTAHAPRQALSPISVSSVVRVQMHRAKVTAPNFGSHLLRHTCVQRLVDSGFSLKTIGDYVGHTSVASTEVYSKINVESLREVAVAAGDEVL